MERAKKFGTFGGVFTPAILTILGVIMYLRLGWIVGQAGLFYTIVIILIAHVISVTTGLSLSSIATDKKIKAGGIYYMLSRSLGLPMGGAIGATIFLGTALSIAFYLVGFAESFLAVDSIRNFLQLEQDIASYKIISSVSLLLIVIIAFISTSLAIKVQYFVLTAIGLSIVSIVTGILTQPVDPLSGPSVSPLTTAPSLQLLFAVFFPAVTGFTVGVSMSGDLKDPKNSLPRGTLWAIFAGLLIYLGLAVIFAMFVDRDLLINDSAFLQKVALVPVLVLAGIWGATISSAMGGILGGPRIVQALARDRLAPKPLGLGFGINNQPRVAIILTWLLAQAGIMMGDLNTIARVVSMFYITAYAFINLAFSLESWASTDFRPSFKIPRWVGWLGFAASFMVMLQIDPIAMVIAFALIWAVWYIMKRREQKLEPGDVWQSVWANLVRKSLHITNKGLEERNWKPNIMLFSGNPDTRPHLTELGKALIANHGLLTIMNITKNKYGDKPRPRFLQKDSSDLLHARTGVFTREYNFNDVFQGIETLAETYGFAGVEPNTVLMGWTGRTSSSVRFARVVKHIIDLDLNLLLMDYDQKRGFGKRKTIDIWWRDSGNNGNLALNLVKFLWLSEGWKESRLRLMIENRVNDERENIFNFAREVLDNLRINAEIIIINNEIDKKPFYDIIRIESVDSDIVFLSIPEMETGKEDEFVDKIMKLCADLGTVVLIKASTQFKKLNIGIKHTPVNQILSAEEKTNLVQLSEESIQWPENPELKTFLQSFASEALRKSLELSEKGFGKILSEYAEVIANAENRVNATFEIIHKRLVNKDADWTDLDNAFYKLSNNTFSRYGQILSYIQSTLLDEQEKKLDLFLKKFETDTSSYLTEVPETIQVSLDTNTLRTSQQIKFLPFLNQLQSRLSPGKPIRLRVKARKIISRYYPHSWFYLQRELGEQFSEISRKYISEQQRVFREFRDSLHTLENTLQNNALDPTMILAEKKKSETSFAGLKEFLASAQKNLLKISEQHTLKTLSEIASGLRAANPNRLKKKSLYPTPPKRTEILILKNFATDWKEQQHLNVNVNSLEISLSETEYKLWHFTQKARKELNELWHNSSGQDIIHLPSQLLRFTENSLEKLQTGKKIEVPEFNILSDKHLHKKIKEIEDLLQEKANLTLSKMPGKLHLLKPGSETHWQQGVLPSSNRQMVEVSRLLHFIVQNDLLVPLQRILRNLSQQLGEVQKEVLDIIRLMKITLTVDLEEQQDISLDGFFEAQRLRIINVQERMYNLVLSTNDKIDSSFNKVARQLSLATFMKTAENMRLLEKSKDVRPVSNTLYDKAMQAKEIARRNLVKIWYDRSKRIVFADQAKIMEKDVAFPVNDFHKLLEAVSYQKPASVSVPAYYQSLFLRKNNYFMDFWYGKPAEINEAAKIIDRHNDGFTGALLVRGEQNSGKSFFVNYITHNFLQKRNIYTLTPPFAGSTSEAEFIRVLQKALENTDNTRKSLDQLPEKTVIIIEDLELWWEKTQKGFKVISLLTSLIERYGNKILFIITVNTYSFNSINNFVPLDSYLLGVINCKPFNAEEIKNIIIQRHKAGNMKFVYQGKKESEMRSWDYARLFNIYFNYTRGNVGLSLQTWMANIIKAEGETIYIKQPKRPDVSVMSKISAETLVFLMQFILHKRLNLDKLERIMLLPPMQIKKRVKLLLRAAILIEPARGVYTLNPALHTFIRERIFEKELL
jgi:amino acid transporter